VADARSGELTAPALDIARSDNQQLAFSMGLEVRTGPIQCSGVIVAAERMHGYDGLRPS
jgi:hypothetical protein